MRRVALAEIGIALGVVLAGIGPAAADTVVLMNSGILSGVVDLSEVVVSTPGGEVRLAPRDIQSVTLGPAAGDIVLLRTGRTLTGRLEHGDYTVRLPRGQTFVFPRSRVDRLHFSAR